VAIYPHQPMIMQDQTAMISQWSSFSALQLWIASIPFTATVMLCVFCQSATFSAAAPHFIWQMRNRKYIW
jgi:hypothetical protein